MRHHSWTSSAAVVLLWLVSFLALALGLVRPENAVADNKMYWMNPVTDKIQRADLDGANVEDVVTTGLDSPSGIALDLAGKMYWTDSSAHKIQRADLDGANVEELVTTGLRLPKAIALDLASGKMYWTDTSTDKIQRSDLDGSNVEDLVTTGLLNPFGIALDLFSGKMYWVDTLTGKIQRADLDGANVEDLVTTGLNRPAGIALDLASGKMYWTDWGAHKIQRSDLDGANVEDLVTTGLNRPAGIALDLASGKMYWTNHGTSKIQRADLDGANVEDLVTTEFGPDAIALDLTSICPPQPLTGCVRPILSGMGKLTLKNNGGSKDRLKFTLKKLQATSLADFGDPTIDTKYSWCLYEQDLLIQEARTQPGANWRAGRKGFKYKDKSKSPDGLMKVTLNAGESGKAKLTLGGKGPKLHNPTTPLNEPVTGQLINSEGMCWDAEFSGAKKNDAGQYNAKGE